MKLSIVQAGEPILRQQARELSLEEIQSPRIQHLIESMTETLRHAPGVGLAAPQIGEGIQLIVIEDRPEYTEGIPREELIKRERVPVPIHVIINPRIVVNESGSAHFFEGCLSLKGLIGLVPRALQVKVDCLNEKAEPIHIDARGWYARILQHEINHLQGILCVDHMWLRSLMLVENYTKYWRDTPIEEVIDTLNIIPRTK